MDRNPIDKPITRDNFPEMWSIVDAQRRRAKKKKFISGMTAFFGHMLLALLILLAGNGLLYSHTAGSYRSFLEGLPHFLPLWEGCSALLLKPEQSWQIQTLICLLAILAVCFVFCLILVLILMLLYHPLKKKLPTQSPGENAKLMLSLAHEARVCSNDTRRTGAAVVWTFLCLLAYFMVFQLYVVEAGVSREQIMQFLYPDADMYSQVSNTVFSLITYAGAFVVILLYSLIAALHTFTVRFLYRCKVPYAFVAAVEEYAVFADEETDGLSAEQLLARRRETAEAKRAEALYLESIGAYGRSKQLLAEAAHAGDVAAMEHYARHNLIAHFRDPARYWLEKAIESGQASPEAAKNLRRLKWRRKINVRYLNETDKVER